MRIFRGLEQTTKKKLLLLALLSTAIGFNFNSAMADDGLAITHEMPAAIEPGADLTLTFSITGDCEGTAKGSATKDRADLGEVAATAEAKRDCGPVMGGIHYWISTSERKWADATVSDPDVQLVRTATVTVPAADLPPGTSFTYQLAAQQRQQYTRARAGAGLNWGWAPFCLPIPMPYPVAEADGGGTVEMASWGPKTIKIAGEPSSDAPGAPVVTGSRGDQSARLEWPTPSSGADYIRGYNIYRSSPGEDATFIGFTWNRSFWEGGLSNGVKYVYQVSAVNSFGEGTLSNPVEVTPAGLPWDVSASLVHDPDGVRVEWDWSQAGDNGSGVTSFKVYRSTGYDDLQHIASVPATYGHQMYLDTTVEDSTTYRYKVQAVNDVGEGGGPIKIVTSAPLPPPVIVSPVEGSLYPRKVLVTGTAEPGLRVRLFRDDTAGELLHSEFVVRSGKWGKWIYPGDGPLTLVADVTQGTLVSQPSQKVEILVDGLAPKVGADDVNLNHDGLGVTGEEITGWASDNRTVQRVMVRYWKRYFNGYYGLVQSADAVCDCGAPDATWSHRPDLPEGEYRMEMKVIDAAGNESEWTRNTSMVIVTEAGMVH